MKSVETEPALNLKDWPSRDCPQDWTVKDPRMKAKEPRDTTSSWRGYFRKITE